MNIKDLSTQRSAQLIALMVFFFALLPTAGLATDALRLAMEGRGLSAEEVDALEAGLAENPADLDTRIKLLGFYRMASNAEVQSARLGHILWIIEHHPEAGVLGTPFAQLSPMMDKETRNKFKDLWLKQLVNHKNDPMVHGNAGGFFILTDRELATESFAKAQSLEPANPKWPQRLGHLYSLDMMSQSGEEKKATAARSLEQFEKALAVAEGIARRGLLMSTAKVAFASGDLKKARSYALEMVGETDKSSWDYGNSIHHGNLLLGQLALGSGDVETAKLHLIEAGKTPGSPQLNSFGPNMALAKGLLEKGESEIVLEYFELCGKFWQDMEGSLKTWAGDVQAGRTPSFGASLSY